MTILLPLAAAAATVAAQGLGGFKNQLAAPDGSYGSRIQITEHGTAASAVSSMQTNQSGVKIRGYRVRIFSDNSQNARSAGAECAQPLSGVISGHTGRHDLRHSLFQGHRRQLPDCGRSDHPVGKDQRRFRPRIRRPRRDSVVVFQGEPVASPPTVPPGMPPQRVIFRGFRSRRRFGYTKISDKTKFLPGKFIFRQKFHWITVPITNHFYTFAPE